MKLGNEAIEGLSGTCAIAVCAMVLNTAAGHAPGIYMPTGMVLTAVAHVLRTRTWVMSEPVSARNYCGIWSFCMGMACMAVGMWQQVGW